MSRAHYATAAARSSYVVAGSNPRRCAAALLSMLLPGFTLAPTVIGTIDIAWAEAIYGWAPRRGTPAPMHTKTPSCWRYPQLHKCNNERSIFSMQELWRIFWLSSHLSYLSPAGFSPESRNPAVFCPRNLSRCICTRVYGMKYYLLHTVKSHRSVVASHCRNYRQFMVRSHTRWDGMGCSALVTHCVNASIEIDWVTSAAYPIPSYPSVFASSYQLTSVVAYLWFEREEEGHVVTNTLVIFK